MKNILLASHYTETEGILEKMLLYLRKHQNKVIIIKHPLYPKLPLESKIKSEEKEVKFKIFWLFQYIFVGLVSAILYKFNFKNKTKIDLAICFDPLSYLNIYLFRKIYQVGKIVYFNVDFSKQRFENKILNFIYQKFNHFAYKKCDYFFYLFRDFIKYVDQQRKYVGKTFLLKHWIDTSAVKLSTKKIPNSLVFAGNLNYAVNFSEIFKALKKLSREIPICLDIYGEGPKKNYLINQIIKHGLENTVFIKGMYDNKTLTRLIMPKYKIGVVPYNTSRKIGLPDHIFNASDFSTKQVEYLAAGLPIVATLSFSALKILMSKRLGFIVETAEEWYQALKKLLLDANLYQQYRRNALNLSKNYDEEKVLTPVFQKILNN